MLKKGFTLGASIFGKIKTVAYIITVGAALLVNSIERLELFESLLPHLKTGALIIYIISVIFAVISFFDYYLIYKRTKSK
jgi:phosphatidylglycerophosphate synthase